MTKSTVELLLDDLEALRCDCALPHGVVARLVGVAEVTYKTWVSETDNRRTPSSKQESGLRLGCKVLANLYGKGRLPMLPKTKANREMTAYIIEQEKSWLSTLDGKDSYS